MILRWLFSGFLLAFFTLFSAAEAVAADAVLTGVYRVEGTNPGDGSRYTAMAAVTQNGSQYTVRWWHDKKTLTGTGQLESGKLVITSGDAAPAVYTLRSDGTLKGESEVMKPYGLAASQPLTLKQGTYRAAGHSPDGKSYVGTATVAVQDNRYVFQWHVDSNTMNGEGTAEGNILTVDWHDKMPVIFAITGEGTVKGLWAAGAGDETLTLLR